jgi:cytochrome c oxidase subunit IV
MPLLASQGRATTVDSVVALIAVTGYVLSWVFYAHFYARYAILFCIILRLFCILVFSILNLTGIS